MRDLSIIIKAIIDDTNEGLKEINKSIAKLSNNPNLRKLDLGININDKDFKKIFQQVELIGKHVASSTKGIKIIDEGEIRKQGQIVIKSVDEIREKYKHLGKIKITQNIDEATGKIKSLIAEIEKANGVIERLKFSPIGLSKKDGSIDTNQFLLEEKKIIDKTSEMRQKLWEQEKRRLEEEAKQREKVLNEEIALRNKLNKIQEQEAQKQKEKIEALQHELNLYKQKAAIQVQEARRRYDGLISTSALDQYLGKVNSLTVDPTNLKETKRQMRDLSMEFRQIEADAKTAANAIDIANKSAISFGEALKTAFIKFPIWMVASTAFYQTFGFFNEGIRYVNDLNKALTEISIVTGKTQEQVEQLGLEYQKLAKQMGATTKEIARASVELLRQGLSEEETMKRLVKITQYAKISGLNDFKTAAEILTATVNSMGVSIERASDVFSYLGDATATGADELGQAFQRVGGSAGALNLEFEKVASWIAVLSSRTREGAGTIGNAVKSILARIQNLQETGFDETDGTQINDVAKALAEVDIALVDANGQFRNFGQVMDELGTKWKKLDSRTKAYLATTIAG